MVEEGRVLIEEKLTCFICSSDDSVELIAVPNRGQQHTCKTCARAFDPRSESLESLLYSKLKNSIRGGALKSANFRAWGLPKQYKIPSRIGDLIIIQHELRGEPHYFVKRFDDDFRFDFEPRGRLSESSTPSATPLPNLDKDNKSLYSESVNTLVFSNNTKKMKK